jgi:hypothetical protein
MKEDLIEMMRVVEEEEKVVEKKEMIKIENLLKNTVEVEKED